MRPIVVVKEMRVPFCTGVPPADGVVVVPVPDPPDAVPCSMTVATICIWLFRATVVDVGMRVMTVPVGARSGTLSHAATQASGRRSAKRMARRCATIKDANNNSLMSLRGQEQNVEAGYAMAALLVALAV